MADRAEPGGAGARARPGWVVPVLVAIALLALWGLAAWSAHPHAAPVLEWQILAALLAAILGLLVLLGWLIRAERRASELAGRLGEVLAAVPAVHYRCRVEPGGRCTPTFVSERLRDWGYDPEAPLGDPGWWPSRVHPHDRSSVLPRLGAALAGEATRHIHEYRLRAADGSYRWVRDELTIVRDPGGGAREIVGSWLDVTDRQRLARELEWRALHDPLTGLPGRELLLDRLGQAIREAQHGGSPVALLAFEAANLREVNSALGHRAGDRLLTESAARLAALVQAAGTLARVGSATFTLLLPGADATHATALARDLAERMDEPLRVEDTSVPIVAHVGIAAWPAHASDADDLLSHAESALDQARSSGLPVKVFDPATNPYSRRRIRLLADLRAALERGQGLELHVQPKVDLRAGARVVGGEALGRWTHPEDGPIPPAEFVPLAEQGGLVGPLTERVLGEALALLGAWHRDGVPLGLAVNVSMENLAALSHGARLAGLLAGHGGPIERLTLEVTETALMRDPQVARQVLAGCHALGARLSIDDFGTGYSSLAYLRTLPVQELKIDASFVTSLLDDPRSEILVRNVVRLGHELGLEVVAEGVERREVAGHLRGLGCDLAQGFLIARPMPAADFITWCSGLPRDAEGRPSAAQMIGEP